MTTPEKSDEPCEMDSGRSEEGYHCSERNTKRIRLTVNPRNIDVDSVTKHELSSETGNDDEDVENSEDSPFEPEMEMQVEKVDEKEVLMRKDEQTIEEIVAGICLLEVRPLFDIMECKSPDHAAYEWICRLGRGMAKLILMILDQEDFELRLFHKELMDQLLGLSRELYEHKDLAAIINGDIDVEKYELVRESHIGFVLKYIREWDWPPDFLPVAPRLPAQFFGFETKGYDDIVKLVQEVNEECKGFPDDKKMHLLLEFKRRSCVGMLDAVLLDAWREMEVEELVKILRINAGVVYTVLFELVDAKFNEVRLFCCYATEPLQLHWLGAFSEEVLDVVREANIRRRWQGQRFVSPSHIFWALSQSKIAAATDKLFHSVSDCFREVPAKHPAYGIYKHSQEVASILDAKEVGIEHLALATVLSATVLRGRYQGRQDFDTQELSNFLTLEIVKVFLEDVKREKQKPNEFSECIGHAERPPGVSFFERPRDFLVKVSKSSNWSLNQRRVE